MSAYSLVDVSIHDPDSYKSYKKLTPASIAAFGCKFIVRGAQCEIWESIWQPQGLVILEFPSVGRAKAWWSSEHYVDAKNLLQRIATTNMLVVSGFDG